MKNSREKTLPTGILKNKKLQTKSEGTNNKNISFGQEVISNQNSI